MRGLKLAGRIVSGMVTALLAFLLVCNLYSTAMQKITGENQVGVFGYSSAVVISGSMSGSIEVNDMVIIHKQDNYAVGDVITFESGNSLVTHRIVEETENGFVTKGDSNNTVDEEVVFMNQIVGCVVFVIPQIGLLIEYLRTPLGMLCLVLFGFLLIEIPALADWNLDRKTRRKQ